MNTLPDVHPVHRAQKTAAAYWSTGPGAGDFRSASVPSPRQDEVRVRTLYTGVSRGTETLVSRGEVPQTERDRMRAPHQEGDFPFPVKYGYLNVGIVEQGPELLRGRTVFTLFPHQSAFVIAASAVAVVPDGIPARRAVLAGAVETAVNVLWDAAPRLGDRIAVVGAGMIGAAIARLATGMPEVDVTLIDVEPTREPIASALGSRFAVSGAAAGAGPDDDYDIVIEASGTPDGLATALRLAPTDGEVIVASWYGTAPAVLDLGADFHARRLTIRASQVGEVAASRRARRTNSQRLELALRMLRDPAFEVLLGANSPWTDLPTVMAALAAGESGPGCHTIDWSDS